MHSLLFHPHIHLWCDVVTFSNMSRFFLMYPFAKPTKLLKTGSHYIIPPITENIWLGKPASAVTTLRSCGSEAGKKLNY